MAMVGVDSGSPDSQPKSSGLVLGRRPLGALLHSSNEPGKLSQWLCHDDSTINIVLVIIIIINLAICLSDCSERIFSQTVKRIWLKFAYGQRPVCPGHCIFW